MANIYDISSMFYGASSFNRKYVSHWDVDDFDEMFCSLFRTDEDIRVAVKLMVFDHSDDMKDEFEYKKYEKIYGPIHL